MNEVLSALMCQIVL